MPFTTTMTLVSFEKCLIQKLRIKMEIRQAQGKIVRSKKLPEQLVKLSTTTLIIP